MYNFKFCSSLSLFFILFFFCIKVELRECALIKPVFPKITTRHEESICVIQVIEPYAPLSDF